jgi:hypothetical protein
MWSSGDNLRKRLSQPVPTFALGPPWNPSPRPPDASVAPLDPPRTLSALLRALGLFLEHLLASFGFPKPHHVSRTPYDLPGPSQTSPRSLLAPRTSPRPLGSPEAFPTPLDSPQLATLAPRLGLGLYLLPPPLRDLWLPCDVMAKVPEPAAR